MAIRLKTVVLALALLASTLAAPTARPAFFETDLMLQVGEKSDSSYAENYNRANFETDPMLRVGEVTESSYAENYKRANFETDPMLQVEREWILRMLKATSNSDL